MRSRSRKVGVRLVTQPSRPVRIEKPPKPKKKRTEEEKEEAARLWFRQYLENRLAVIKGPTFQLYGSIEELPAAPGSAQCARPSGQCGSRGNYGGQGRPARATTRSAPSRGLSR